MSQHSTTDAVAVALAQLENSLRELETCARTLPDDPNDLDACLAWLTRLRDLYGAGPADAPCHEPLGGYAPAGSILAQIHGPYLDTSPPARLLSLFGDVPAALLWPAGRRSLQRDMPQGLPELCRGDLAPLFRGLAPEPKCLPKCLWHAERFRHWCLALVEWTTAELARIQDDRRLRLVIGAQVDARHVNVEARFGDRNHVEPLPNACAAVLAGWRDEGVAAAGAATITKLRAIIPRIPKPARAGKINRQIRFACPPELAGRIS